MEASIIPTFLVIKTTTFFFEFFKSDPDMTKIYITPLLACPKKTDFIYWALVGYSFRWEHKIFSPN